MLTPGDAYGPSGPFWTYSDPVSPLSAPVISSAERLPNGNTLICSGGQSWLFEVDVFGQIVWQYFTVIGNDIETPFHAHYYEQSLWCEDRSVSLSMGGTIDLELIAGTQYSDCLLYTSPSPRDRTRSRMPSSA